MCDSKYSAMAEPRANRDRHDTTGRTLLVTACRQAAKLWVRPDGDSGYGGGGGALAVAAALAYFASRRPTRGTAASTCFLPVGRSLS